MELHEWVGKVLQAIGDYLMRLGLFLLKQRPEGPFPAPPSIPGPPSPPSPTPPGKHKWPDTRFGQVPAWLQPLIVANFDAADRVAAGEISFFESGWNPRAVNDTRPRADGKCNVPYWHPGGFWARTEWSIGLFQINACASGGDFATWSNARLNVEKAGRIKRSRGNWSAWKIAATRLGYPI